ncbi:GNAT family N-acetyltransferase [Methanosarcinales archaeon]|nr:MAG: GNAT family N-acetyltransferase [Methanosarcinales archaeon]
MSLKITNSFKKQLYEDFVYENPNTSIFQTLEMAEVYKRNKNCTPLVLVAIDEDTDEIVVSLLAKILAEKSGVLSSFSKHSTIRGGPIFRDDDEGVIATSQLLCHYNEISKKKVLYSRIYPLNNTPQIMPSFRGGGYEHGDWQNLLLHIDAPINEIWAQLKKNRKYGVNRAKKKDVIIEEVEDKELLPVFYNLLQETYRKRGGLLEDISTFEATFDLLVPKNMAKFFIAKYEDRYIAALLILQYKGVAYEWYIGSSKKREDLLLCPNDLIVWHAIELCTNNGFHTFDFGGGGLPSEMDAGWVRFKKEFGGRLVNYGRYTKVHQPRKLWFSLKAFEIYKRLFLRPKVVGYCSAKM